MPVRILTTSELFRRSWMSRLSCCRPAIPEQRSQAVKGDRNLGSIAKIWDG